LGFLSSPLKPNKNNMIRSLIYIQPDWRSNVWVSSGHCPGAAQAAQVSWARRG
jgi:hypothetical protein